MQDILDFLDSNNIEYTVYEHPKVFTVEESKELKLDVPGAHSKNLFLKNANQPDDYYLVCLQADKRLDIKILQKQLDIKKLTFGSSEELFQELKTTPGSVSLFGLIYSKHTKLVINKELLEADEVGWHPNDNSRTVVMKQSEINSLIYVLRSMDVEVIKIAEM